MARENVTEDEWRRTAVVALSDLQAIGMDLSAFLDHLSVDDKESILKEVDLYMWQREHYN